MGRGVNSGDSNLKLFFMKITGLMHEKGEKITIEQTEAREKGKHVKLDETVQYVEGQLQKVEVREYSPRAGEKALELKVWLKDTEAGEMYIVGCNMNIIGRSILNTILSLEPPFGVLRISVYNNPKKENRPAVSVRHNGAKTGWKFSLEEQEKYIVKNTITKNGVTKYENDYWDLNNFLAKELREKIAPHFSQVPSQFQDNNHETPIGGNVPLDVLIPEEVGEDSSDDLPF